jgi:hypothetical protein
MIGEVLTNYTLTTQITEIVTKMTEIITKITEIFSKTWLFTENFIIWQNLVILSKKFFSFDIAVHFLILYVEKLILKCILII